MNEWSRLKLVTAASGLAVTVEDAKRHLRVFHDDEDADIEGMIGAAIAAIEGPNGIGIALTEQTWRLSLDYFPSCILVPLGPITEIVSISYGADTVPSWRADFDTQPLRILPARDASWPSVTCEPGAVKVEFKCGYATIPADLRWAVLLMVGHFFEHREAVTTDLNAMDLPMGVASILERYRVGRFA
jgi:uncharacterized phiE125 gp8 family phage protein